MPVYVRIPEKIKLPYYPSPCVYSIVFPDLKKPKIYIGMTMYPLPVRIHWHFRRARGKYTRNIDLEKLIRCALSGKEKMVVKILDRGIFEEKDLRQSEAERVMEVLEAGKYELLNIHIPNNIVDGKKICSVCGEIKSDEKFVRASRNTSGLSSCCKACKRERDNISYHKKKILTQKRANQYTLYSPVKLSPENVNVTANVTGAMVLSDTSFATNSGKYLFKIPKNIKLPYDPSPCVYSIVFPDLMKIYIGQTICPLPVRMDNHFRSIRGAKYPNIDLVELIRRALSGKEKMEVKILAKDIYTKKELRQKEAERIKEVRNERRYTLLNIKNPSHIVGEKKICTNCGERKAPEKFRRRPDTSSGLTSWCKACINESNRERGPYPISKEVLANGKKCSCCEKTKSAKEFHRNRRDSSGLSSQCKACSNEAKRELNYPISEEVLANGKECFRCKKVKSAEKFSRARRDSSGLNSWCKACYREHYHKKQAKILAQNKVVQYTLFPDISAHASVSATGAIVPINT